MHPRFKAYLTFNTIKVKILPSYCCTLIVVYARMNTLFDIYAYNLNKDLFIERMGYNYKIQYGNLHKRDEKICIICVLFQFS